MTGGINCPPSEDADSIAAAVAGGMPAPIMEGMVAEPMVIAFAAPLPLTVPTHIEPTTADCGSACADRMATRFVARSNESAAEAAQQTEHQQKRAHRRERDLRQARE